MSSPLSNILDTLSADRRDIQLAAVTSALVSIVQNIDGSGNTDRRVSPGELFAVILTSLTKGERVLELLKLLNATIQYVPPPLVKANVKALLKLTKGPSNSDKAVSRQSITLYGSLVVIAGGTGGDATGGDDTTQCVRSILSSLSSPTPKTRKHAAATLRTVLQSSSGPLTPVVQAVEDFLLEALPSSPSQVLTLLLPLTPFLTARVAIPLTAYLSQPVTLPFLSSFSQSHSLTSDVSVAVVSSLLKNHGSVPKASAGPYASCLSSFDVSGEPKLCQAVVQVLMTFLSTNPQVAPVFKKYTAPLATLNAVKIAESLGKRVSTSPNGEGCELLGWWGETKPEALKVVVENLVAVHGNTTNNKSKRSILAALESIVSARGHEEVVALGILDPLVLSALQSPSDVPTTLKTFQSALLPLARKSDVASRSSTVTAEERAAHKARVDAVWTVAVPFCAAAPSADERVAFVPTVVKVMGDTKYDLLGVGCKCISSMMSAEVAEKVGVKVLASLFNVADKAKGDTVKVNLVCGCISDVVAAGAPVQGVFKKLLPRILTLVAPPFDGDKVESINHLLTLLSSILPGITASDATAVYRTTKAIIGTGKCGKKAFRVLASLLGSHPSTVLEAGPEDVVKVITETLMSCDVGSRLERLKSLRQVLETLDNKRHPDVIPGSVGEVLLCLKDSNGKVRDEAYGCLAAAFDARGDPRDFVHIVLGAVAARTPHMRSAAVMALSRVVFDRRDCEITRSMVGEVLGVVCVLFREKAREVIKSAVGEHTFRSFAKARYPRS